jgi:hypothetical protein
VQPRPAAYSIFEGADAFFDPTTYEFDGLEVVDALAEDEEITLKFDAGVTSASMTASSRSSSAPACASAPRKTIRVSMCTTVSTETTPSPMCWAARATA